MKASPEILTTKHKQMLSKLGVQAIYLFGSRALQTHTAASDYDYAILMQNKGHSKGDDVYFALYNLLTEISPRTLENDIIDIVYLRDVGLELRFHVIRYGQVIYDHNPQARINFEVETELLYCDYRPLLDEFDKIILEGL